VVESLIVIGSALAISVGASWLRYVLYGSAKQTFGHSQVRGSTRYLARLAIVQGDVYERRAVKGGAYVVVASIRCARQSANVATRSGWARLLARNPTPC
jgi:hypothetical protein